MGEEGNYRKIVNIICQKTAKGMKTRNKTVEMEMQGTRGLLSVLFIKLNKRSLLLNRFI